MRHRAESSRLAKGRPLPSRPLNATSRHTRTVHMLLSRRGSSLQVTDWQRTVARWRMQAELGTSARRKDRDGPISSAARFGRS